MYTQIQYNMQRVVGTATTLVVIGVVLNVFVIETLGSFDAASVILALYVAAWAFVLGDIGLILSALWFFMNRKAVLAAQVSGQPEAGTRAPIAVKALRLAKPCYGC